MVLKIWNDGVYFCAVIKEGYAALSIYPYPGYIFDPMQLVKGIGIQEGSLVMMSYALGIPSWDAFDVVTFP